MRVELTIDGGFAYLPGLAQPMVTDGATLADADARELRRLCRAALAAAEGIAAKPSPAMPDARCYRLTIDSDGATHELNVSDPIAQPAVAALIAFVRDHGGLRHPS